MEKSHQKHGSLKTGSPRIIGQDPVRYEGWGVRVPPMQEVSSSPPTHTHSEMRFCGLIDFLEAVIEKDESVRQSFLGINRALRLRMQARVKAHANLAWMRRHWSRTPVVFWDRLQDFPYPDMLYNGNMRQSGLYKYPHGDPARWDSYNAFGPEYHRPWGLELYS